jgi:hypothetical protein
MTDTSELDRPLYGAEAIGREAEMLDGKGKVDLNRVYYALERGHIDASKFGRVWVTTRRRIRSAFTGQPVTT